IITGLSSRGTYRVTRVAQAGWRNTGWNTVFDLNADTLPAFRAMIDFSYTQSGIVKGTIYEDVKADGKRTGGDNALQGKIAYVDQNENGLREWNEPMDWTDYH